MEKHMILDYDTDFIITSSMGLDDLLKLIILSALVKKICRPKNGRYYFTGDDETLENKELINKFYETILKIAPCKNRTSMNETKKRVYSFIRHLCKSLSHHGITFESRIIGVKDENNNNTTKYAHFVNGLENMKI